MAVEAKRGCGYRKVNGLYVVGGGLSAPCDRMPFPLERCPTCGGGIKFTRGPQWLQPDFFTTHAGPPAHAVNGLNTACRDRSPCPVCRTPMGHDFGPHLLLWIGRKHYTPEAYLEEGRRMGVSRRLSALPKGLVLGETWALLAHLDAVLPKNTLCTECGMSAAVHADQPDSVFKGGIMKLTIGKDVVRACGQYQAPKPTPGIFCAFVPRAIELLLKESDATPERCEKEARRGVTVVAVPDDDRDHQGSVWDRDEDESQPELPVVTSSSEVPHG